MSARAHGGLAVALVGALAFALTACVPNAPVAGGSKEIAVESNDSNCTVATATAVSGTIVFRVTNSGTRVTEFYLLGSDREHIEGEVENIGPGLTRSLVVQLPAGRYFTACKPGMAGTAVGLSEFTVTESGAPVTRATVDPAKAAAASDAYDAYVAVQADALLDGTEKFAAAFRGGDFAGARRLYAPTRQHWERIETVAESFPALDEKLDLREADLTPGQSWTGWHAIEKVLWPPQGFHLPSTEERIALAHALAADTKALRVQIAGLHLTLAQQTNGAIGLLEEVAAKKVTGEEEAWSHTDLWDFQANVDGAHVLYRGVRDLVLVADPVLAARLDDGFARLQALLDNQRSGDGFVSYDRLTTAEVRALSDQVNALAEPLSRLTAILVPS